VQNNIISFITLFTFEISCAVQWWYTIYVFNCDITRCIYCVSYINAWCRIQYHLNIARGITVQIITKLHCDRTVPLFDQRWQHRSWQSTSRLHKHYSETIRLYYDLNKWSTIHIGKLIGAQSHTEFRAFYGRKRFITVMMMTVTGRYAKPDKRKYIRKNTLSLKFILILLSHLRTCISDGLFSSGFNPLRPSGNYINRMLWQSVTLHFVFIGFVWFSL
jgi:hypothetical protein